MNPTIGISWRRSYLCADSVQIFTHIRGVILPKFSDGEQIWLSSLLANVLDERGDEIPFDMLDGIETKSGSAMAESRDDPRPPLEEIGGDIWVFMVDISAH